MCAEAGNHGVSHPATTSLQKTLFRAGFLLLEHPFSVWTFPKTGSSASGPRKPSMLSGPHEAACPHRSPPSFLPTLTLRLYNLKRDLSALTHHKATPPHSHSCFQLQFRIKQALLPFYRRNGGIKRHKIMLSGLRYRIPFQEQDLPLASALTRGPVGLR